MKVLVPRRFSGHQETERVRIETIPMCDRRDHAKPGDVLDPVPTDEASHFAPTRRKPEDRHVSKIQVVDELREVVGIVIPVVAVPQSLKWIVTSSRVLNVVMIGFSGDTVLYVIDGECTRDEAAVEPATPDACAINHTGTITTRK